MVSVLRRQRQIQTRTRDDEDSDRFGQAKGHPDAFGQNQSQRMVFVATLRL